jgi:glutamate synthase (NADPH/NADH) small chain
MAKPTGFMEYEREVSADVPPEERVKSWGEFHTQMSEEALKTQAAAVVWTAACPIAHRGAVRGPGNGLPPAQPHPRFNDLVYRGLWQQALDG